MGDHVGDHVGDEGSYYHAYAHTLSKNLRIEAPIGLWPPVPFPPLPPCLCTATLGTRGCVCPHMHLQTGLPALGNKYEIPENLKSCFENDVNPRILLSPKTLLGGEPLSPYRGVVASRGYWATISGCHEQHGGEDYTLVYSCALLCSIVLAPNIFDEILQRRRGGGTG